MNDRKPKLNAESAYENAHLVAQDLVQRIGELLFDLPAPSNDELPITWADVGTVNEVNGDGNTGAIHPRRGMC